MDSSLPPHSILVVDDDEVMREILSAIFVMEGHTVEAVSSGANALMAMQQSAFPFDVLLADLQMPGLSGATLAQQLRELRGPQTILLGMSGSEPTEPERALFDAFLLKPFDISDFEEALARSRTASVTVRQATSPEAPASAPASPALDEATYSKLAATLPAPQLEGLYSMALADGERRIEAIRAAFDRKDFAECRREAHAIKGGCGMVGAAELSALAAQVETSAFEGTPPFVEFTSACLRLRRILDARFKTPN